VPAASALASAMSSSKVNLQHLLGHGGHPPPHRRAQPAQVSLASDSPPPEWHHRVIHIRDLHAGSHRRHLRARGPREVVMVDRRDMFASSLPHLRLRLPHNPMPRRA
jgi:hypothetical protein